MAAWHFRLAERELGPVAPRELAAMAMDGRLQPEDLVRRDDHSQWIAAAKVSGLKFPEVSPPPLPDMRAAPVLSAGNATHVGGTSRKRTWMIGAVAATLAVVSFAGWFLRHQRDSERLVEGDEVYRLARPPEVDTAALTTKLSGTFRDDENAPTVTMTFSGGSWRCEGGGQRESGVFDVVRVDDDGKLTPTGRAGYVLLLKRLVIDDPVTILPIRAFLGADGQVERLQIKGISEGPLGRIFDGRELAMSRGRDAPALPGQRFSRPITGSDEPAAPVKANPAPPVAKSTKSSPSATAVRGKSSPATHPTRDAAPTSAPPPMPKTPEPIASPSRPAPPPAVASATVARPITLPPTEPPKPAIPDWKSGIRFVRIPAGEFWMGSSEQDRSTEAAEKPRHRVRLTKDFYISAREITVGEFRKFVEATNYRTTVEKNGLGGWQANWSTSKGKRSPTCTWTNPGFSQTDDHPVVVVSWDDAAAFCKWLSTIEETECRLPTEAEWEYACRAGSEDARHIGSEPLTNFAWLSNNSDAKTHPVGLLKPNAFGLYDTYGNVREWCLDRYQAPYSASASTADPTGPSVGSHRCCRGGSWQDGSSFVRSAKRGNYLPDEALNNLGFRVVRSGVAP